jgi:Na+/H+ antiporter NhaD/arsenite permease-like protein
VTVSQPGQIQQTGQEAAPGAALKFRQLPYLAVLFCLVVGLVLIWQGVHLVQSGTLVLAGALLIAALARLILPERRAGMLSSRRRSVDVAIFGVLGIGLLVAGIVVPAPG